MKNNLTFLIILLNLFFTIISVVQDWDLENSSVDIFSISNPYTVKLYEGNIPGMYVLLNKELYKDTNTGAITITNKLIVARGYNDNIYDGVIDFENIESFYQLGSDYIICPKGKFQPTYFHGGTYSRLNNANFVAVGDWELKCYYHGTGYFLVFYLMNSYSQFFYKKMDTGVWSQKNLHQEIYDLKLNNGTSYGEYEMAYLVKNGDWIKLKGAKYTFNHDGVHQNDCGGEVAIMPASSYTRGCFENNYDHFYFLTYTNASDFSCGYFDSVNSINKQSVGEYSSAITKTTDSPLEFVDDVEIKEIKFLYNYKYAYYTVYNPTTGKTSRGIIDTKKKMLLHLIQKKIF